MITRNITYSRKQNYTMHTVLLANNAFFISKKEKENVVCIYILRERKREKEREMKRERERES